MKREEKLTETYLISLGFKDIIFEPNGKNPPDFLVDNRIAVEARRLNQHFFSQNEVKGLEEHRIPLFKLFESSLKEFDSQYKGYSYWVSIRFHRPIGTGIANKKAIKKALTEFLSKPFPLPYKIEVTDNIYFSIYPRQSVDGEVFRFGSGIDRESGGFIFPEFIRNFNHCVKEKSDKITNYYDKYTSWWLVLIDTIAYGFDKDEKKEIKSMLTINPVWDKVIVLDGIKGKNILEINKNI